MALAEIQTIRNLPTVMAVFSDDPVGSQEVIANILSKPATNAAKALKNITTTPDYKRYFAVLCRESRCGVEEETLRTLLSAETIRRVVTGMLGDYDLHPIGDMMQKTQT